jgi:hypothetical protein
MDETLAGGSHEPAGHAAGPDMVQLTLAPAELELIRTALDFLRSTLGREEADELDAVQRLLARLPPASEERSVA